MNNTSIDHNALDLIFFDEVFSSSKLMADYLKTGTYFMPDFKLLMQDLFFLLYKYNITFRIDTTRTVETELITSLSQGLILQKLRLRTRGSKGDSYIAFKLLCDYLLEKLRGSDVVDTLQNTLNALGKQASFDQYEPIDKEVFLTLDFHSVFSELEWKTLLAIAAHLDPALSDTAVAELLYDLLNILDKDQSEKESTLNDLITKVSPKSAEPQTQTDSASDFIERLYEALSNEDTEEVLSQTPTLDEVNGQEGDVGEDYQKRVKESFEKRFEPLLQDLILTKGVGKPPSQRTKSELDNDSPTDVQIYQDQQIETNEKPVDLQIVKLPRAIEDKLRALGKSQAATTPFDNTTQPHFRNLSTADLDYLEKSIQKQLQSLHFDDMLQQITEVIDEFNTETQVLGIQKRSVDEMSFDDVIKLYKRFTSPKLIQFVNKVGRNKAYASQLQYKKHREKSEPIDKVTSSQNIDLLIDDEYIGLALDIEAFENDFYDRYLRDDLLTIEMIEKKQKRKGPIVLCYDGSGSMEGSKILETQSHILSILEIAKIQKRKLILIQFASAAEPLYIKELNPLDISANDILDVLDTFICGGTDFQKPLSKAMAFIDADPHRKSDILFITDGQCEISAPFKKEFVALKKKRKFKLFTIIMHSYTYQDYGDIGEISDAILDIKEQEQGNWNHETNKKLFSLI